MPALKLGLPAGTPPPPPLQLGSLSPEPQTPQTPSEAYSTLRTERILYGSLELQLMVSAPLGVRRSRPPWQPVSTLPDTMMCSWVVCLAGQRPPGRLEGAAAGASLGLCVQVVKISLSLLLGPDGRLILDLCQHGAGNALHPLGRHLACASNAALVPFLQQWAADRGAAYARLLRLLCPALFSAQKYQLQGVLARGGASVVSPGLHVPQRQAACGLLAAASCRRGCTSHHRLVHRLGLAA